jgi:hypothetical protein
MQVIYKQDARKSVNSLGLVIRLLDGTTIIWPIEELNVTCPLLQHCGVRAKFGTATIADGFWGRSLFRTNDL